MVTIEGALSEEDNIYSGNEKCFSHYADDILNIVSFAFSERGSSHISSGKPCQDSGLIKRFDGGVFICVADGHGGEDYIRSDRGSTLCCRAAYRCMTDTALLSALSRADNQKEAEGLITQLKKSVICRWNELVAADLENDPFTEDELAPLSERTAAHYRAGEYTERAYGTTLLAAVVTGSFCLIIQLGDGRCVILSDGEYASPMPEDEKCVFNQTTSMCDSRAFSETRHCFFSDICDDPEDVTAPENPASAETGGAITGDKPFSEDTETIKIWNNETGRYSRVIPEAVILCTDGISNSFSANEKLYDFYYMVTENLCESSEDDGILSAAIDELREFTKTISKKGSGDDVSLAAVIRVK